MRRTAVELHVRGATQLAEEVLAEASGYPEADEMPPVPPEDEWDPDVILKTGDYREDLGVPPYDKTRP